MLGQLRVVALAFMGDFQMVVVNNCSKIDNSLLVQEN